MAIQTRIVNGLYTEIYVGGGNFITEAAPTNRHHKWKQRLLEAGETLANFREVTAAEWAQIEAADAAWVEPPQWLITLWDALCLSPVKKAGCYNAATGYFELNGLTDITTAQAYYIVADAMRQQYNPASSLFNGALLLGRANIPGDIWYNGSAPQGILYSAANMEAFVLQHIFNENDARSVGISPNTIRLCPKLRMVGHHVYPTTDNGKLFAECPKLETVDFYMNNDGRRNSFSIADCPLLSLDSVASIVKYGSSASKPITVTVHPEVYAKLSDASNTEWHPLMAQATAKQITFATTE